MGKHFFREDAVRRACIELQAFAERQDTIDGPALVARALEHVQTEATETLYPALRFRDMLPMYTGIPAGAKTVVWHEYDSAGMAQVIENYADDVKLADIAARENTSKVKSYGTGYSYSVEDIEALAEARANGRIANLDVTKAMMAREFMERAFNKVVLEGDAAHNLPGFARNSNVTTISAAAAAAGANAPEWNGADKTAQEIFDDLVGLVTSMSNTSDGVHEPRVIALPTIAYNVIATRLFLTSTASPMTILEAFRRQHPGVRVEKWPHLSQAGTGGIPIAIAYDPSPMNMGVVIPREATPEPPQAKNFAFLVPVRGKCGGCIIKRVLSVLYMDDIQS